MVNYNHDCVVSYDDDDDEYRVMIFNAYNIIMEDNNLDEAFLTLCVRQRDLYEYVKTDCNILTMFSDIMKSDKKPNWISDDNEFNFTYLHSYDFFGDFHKILCSVLKQDDASTLKMCDLLKNKIINNI